MWSGDTWRIAGRCGLGSPVFRRNVAGSGGIQAKKRRSEIDPRRGCGEPKVRSHAGRGKRLGLRRDSGAFDALAEGLGPTWLNPRCRDRLSSARDVARTTQAVA